MIRKNRTYIIVTGVMAITLIWLSQHNKNREAKLQSLDRKSDSENVSGEPINTLEGVLWSSDDKLKGNLVLASKYAMIYLKTSRDFSGLVGKSVIVTVDGTLDNFTLLNIEENLTKDGFIQAQ